MKRGEAARLELLTLDESNLAQVSGWMSQPENYRWLDFGRGSQPLALTTLRVLAQRPNHVLRVFVDEHGQPIGLVALSNVNLGFMTALLWYVLGEKTHAGKGYTSRAVAALLHAGFGDMALEAINAWVVEENHASIRVLERNGFRQTGRQRQCHVVDGRRCDRILFDLLACEFRSQQRASCSR